MVFTYAPTAHRLLRGVFAVYKPSTTPIKSLLQEVRARLTEDINKMEQRPQKQMIIFKPSTDINNQKVLNSETDLSLDVSENNLVPTCVPDWFDHPLVQGPRYTSADFKLYTGHILDVHACGVQVLGLHREGEETLEKLKRLTLPRRYKAKGLFGLASVTYGGESKIVEKSTWNHITKEKIRRVLNAIGGAHRNACIEACGFEWNSERAYLMVLKGLLRPDTPTDPMIIGLKLSTLNLPEFTLDVTCINESCTFVREIIHNIGLELRSNAICTHLQRQQDSVFTFDDVNTLLGRNVNTNNVINSIKHSKDLLKMGVMRRKRHFIKTTIKTDKASNPNVLLSGLQDREDTPDENHKQELKLFTKNVLDS